MKVYIKLSVAVFLSMMMVACEDFFEIKNHGGIPADQLYTSVNGAQIGLNGAYDALYGDNLFYYRIYYYLLQATNELEAQKSEEEINQLKNFAYFDASSFVAGYWKNWYSLVSRANDVCSNIYELRNSGLLSNAENQQLDQMIGECNFLRGFAYFYLVRSYGDKLPSHPSYDPAGPGVPIVDTLIVSRQQLFIPRNTLEECWNEIIHCFTAAYNRLPGSWGNDKLGAATKGAAAGYLGQAYMYFQNYAEAKKWFERAMEAGQYELVKNYGENFDYSHENNSESIFEVQFQVTSSYSDLASYMWRRLAPDGVAGGYGQFKVSDEWVNKFREGYELTPGIYDQLLGSIPENTKTMREIAQREVTKAYQPSIGVSVFSAEDFFNLYTGSWDELGDRINDMYKALNPGDQRTNVKTEVGWGKINSRYIQTILNASQAADPRMYDSFFIPGRDSIADNWAGTSYHVYNGVYGFKKYIPNNAPASWGEEKIPYAEGFNSVNQRIFRLGDLYLQYAEACYRTNDMSLAQKYLNKVRRRAWGYEFSDEAMATRVSVDFPHADQSAGDFMNALVAEREKELCLEGHLWFDYLRWNMAETLFTNRGFNPAIHHRLPIPYSERQIVGLDVLLQNSGY